MFVTILSQSRAQFEYCKKEKNVIMIMIKEEKIQLYKMKYTNPTRGILDFSKQKFNGPFVCWTLWT